MNSFKIHIKMFDMSGVLFCHWEMQCLIKRITRYNSQNLNFALHQLLLEQTYMMLSTCWLCLCFKKLIWFKRVVLINVLTTFAHDFCCGHWFLLQWRTSVVVADCIQHACIMFIFWLKTDQSRRANIQTCKFQMKGLCKQNILSYYILIEALKLIFMICVSGELTGLVI